MLFWWNNWISWLMLDKHTPTLYFTTNHNFNKKNLHMYIRFFTVTKIHLTPKNQPFACSKFTRMVELFEAQFVNRSVREKVNLLIGPLTIIL